MSKIWDFASFRPSRNKFYISLLNHRLLQNLIYKDEYEYFLVDDQRMFDKVGLMHNHLEFRIYRLVFLCIPYLQVFGANEFFNGVLNGQEDRASAPADSISL